MVADEAMVDEDDHHMEVAIVDEAMVDEEAMVVTVGE